VEISHEIHRKCPGKPNLRTQNKAALGSGQMLGSDDGRNQKTSQDEPTEVFLAALEQGRERFRQPNSDKAAPRSLGGVFQIRAEVDRDKGGL
jgi:hypothetical protein